MGQWSHMTHVQWLTTWWLKSVDLIPSKWQCTASRARRTASFMLACPLVEVFTVHWWVEDKVELQVLFIVLNYCLFATQGTVTISWPLSSTHGWTPLPLGMVERSYRRSKSHARHWLTRAQCYLSLLRTRFDWTPRLPSHARKYCIAFSLIGPQHPSYFVGFDYMPI